MAPRPLPPIGVLSQFLTYEPETGRFWWNTRTPSDFTEKNGRSAEWICQLWNVRYAGTEAFTAENGTGYKASKIFSQRVLAHRVAWKMMTGDEPPEHIDHIDGRRGNNAFTNLRASSDSLNSKNRGMRPNNKSGVVGVSYRKSTRKWCANINHNKRMVRLGEFVSKQEAVAARRAAEIQFGYAENHGKLREKRYASS